MKIFFVFAIILAVGSASFVQFAPPPLYTAAIPLTTQYHAQDALGQYSYGYSGGSSAKAEYKSLDGVTRGSYSYVDADGELQTVEYTADSANGFQASATNLPKAPIDDRTAPKPVEDTPEVAKAKAEHLTALREAELRAAEKPDDESESNSQAVGTENPNGMEDSSEGNNETTESSNNSAQQSSSENTNENGNGNGNPEITRLSTNGISSIGSELININGLRLNNGLSLGPISGNEELSLSDLNTLSSLQLLNSLNKGNDVLRFPEISPATTSQLLPLSLPSLRLPLLSTPTQGYRIISPSILTAVPSLPATSSQTISRTLPISLSSAFLTKGLH